MSIEFPSPLTIADLTRFTIETESELRRAEDSPLPPAAIEAIRKLGIDMSETSEDIRRNQTFADNRIGVQLIKQSLTSADAIPVGPDCSIQWSTALLVNGFRLQTLGLYSELPPEIRNALDGRPLEQVLRVKLKPMTIHQSASMRTLEIVGGEYLVVGLNTRRDPLYLHEVISGDSIVTITLLEASQLPNV